MTEVLNSETYYNSYTLSIRLMPNGFSFSRYDVNKDNSFEYEELTFPMGTSYLNSLEEAILGNETLLQTYKKVNIIVASDHFTLLPPHMDSPGTRKAFYEFNVEGWNDHIFTNNLLLTNVVNVFGMQEDIYGFITRTFISPKFYHHLSILSEYFVQKSRIGNNRKVICQIRENIIDILCFNKGKLILCNAFQYNHMQDAAFFLLNSWEQIGFDRRKDTLQITGRSELSNKLRAIVGPYLAKVEPIVFPSRFLKYGDESINAPFDLIALPLCEI